MYKVVTENMKSLGLRKNPHIMRFYTNKWVKDDLNHPDSRNDGGIWCCGKLSSARALKKYYEKKYGKARVFECEIGIILYENSYRTKTNKVKLTKEIF